MDLRIQALKLRYWPANNPTNNAGEVLDLDWCWIEAMKGSSVGELRITDQIGGHNNLRIIFYVGDKKVSSPMPVIWILQVLQKKRDNFTTANLVTFKARRLLVIKRFYEHGS